MNEQTLLECVACPLRVIPTASYSLSQEEERIARTVKWAALPTAPSIVPKEVVFL